MILGWFLRQLLVRRCVAFGVVGVCGAASAGRDIFSTDSTGKIVKFHQYGHESWKVPGDSPREAEKMRKTAPGKPNHGETVANSTQCGRMPGDFCAR